MPTWPPSGAVFWAPVCLHMPLSIWMAMELRGADNRLQTQWTLPPFSLALFMGPALPNLWVRRHSATPSTQSMKSMDYPEPSARVLGPALLDRAGGRMEELRQQVSFHWSDEKIIPPPPLLPLDLMRRQTICERWLPDWAKRIWVGNFKTCSCFCGREKDLYNTFRCDGFSHVCSGQPFFWLTCWNNESLIRGIHSSHPPPRRPPCSWVQFLVVGQRCGADHFIICPSLMENRWLAGFQVPG